MSLRRSRESRESCRKERGLLVSGAGKTGLGPWFPSSPFSPGRAEGAVIVYFNGNDSVEAHSERWEMTSGQSQGRPAVARALIREKAAYPYFSSSETFRSASSRDTSSASPPDLRRTSTMPCLRLRGLTTSLTGRPTRSLSLNFTPAASSARSS